MAEPITTEEKIDYIYDTIKKQERDRKIGIFLKWGFRIFMIIYLVYFFKVALPLLIENFTGMLKPSINIEQSEILDKVKSLLGK